MIATGAFQRARLRPGNPKNKSVIGPRCPDCDTRAISLTGDIVCIPGKQEPLTRQAVLRLHTGTARRVCHGRSGNGFPVPGTHAWCQRDSEPGPRTRRGNGLAPALPLIPLPSQTGNHRVITPVS